MLFTLLPQLFIYHQHGTASKQSLTALRKREERREGPDSVVPRWRDEGKTIVHLSTAVTTFNIVIAHWSASKQWPRWKE
ncbi:hypothetical protein HanPI659440_Chr13g0516101 [Helianthus annuus]|nr:hypothetical protein HanPI659440_Chr13g0516101 [Helianthus annuus]